METQRKLFSIVWITILAGCSVAQPARPANQVASSADGARVSTPFPQHLVGTFELAEARAQSGSVYTFRSDGTYRKTIESHASYRACTSGFSAIEAGMARFENEQLTLMPFTGTLQHTDTCQPGRSVEETLRGLSDETFSLRDAGRTLQLTRVSDGAVSVLCRRELPASASL